MNKFGSEDLDLSANFGRLPHALTSFSLDKTTGQATIDGSIPAAVCPPGTYTLSMDWASASGSFSVPEGSVALVFSCTIMPDSEYTWNDSWQYSDFDRFVIHPFYYVMIFARQ